MMRKKPKPGQQAPSEEGPLWLNPYLIGSALGVFILMYVVIDHFFFANTISSEAPVTTESGGSDNSTSMVGKAKAGVFSFFGRTVFSQKPTIDLSNDEMEAMGISPEHRKEFEGVKPENYREKRRLYAMEKYEGGRKVAEERQKAFASFVASRNDGSSGELREAVESLRDSESLGLMKLESFVSRQAERSSTTGSTEKKNDDSLIFAYQTLTDAYIKKNMKSKAKESFLAYLRLMKEKAPGDQGQVCDQAISEIERLNVTSSGN